MPVPINFSFGGLPSYNNTSIFISPNGLIDDGGELRNMWKRTAQKGLWFVGGSFANCRTYSRYVAIQIKAIEEGLLPKR